MTRRCVITVTEHDTHTDTSRVIVDHVSSFKAAAEQLGISRVRYAISPL